MEWIVDVGTANDSAYDDDDDMIKINMMLSDK